MTPSQFRMTFVKKAHPATTTSVITMDYAFPGVVSRARAHLDASLPGASKRYDVFGVARLVHGTSVIDWASMDHAGWEAYADIVTRAFGDRADFNAGTAADARTLADMTATDIGNTTFVAFHGADTHRTESAKVYAALRAHLAAGGSLTGQADLPCIDADIEEEDYNRSFLAEIMGSLGNSGKALPDMFTDLREAQVARNAKAEADGTGADGTEDDGTEDDGTGADGTEDDGTEDDGTEDDGTEADGTGADDTEADDSEADDTEADDTEADDTEADGTEADGTEADGTEADGTEDDGTEADGTEADDTEYDFVRSGAPCGIS